MKDIIEFTIKSKNGETNKYWLDIKRFNQYEDWINWGVFDNQRYWEKYPESKPKFPLTRVTLDEADKQPR